jgi:membrane peptidoglycan carboxypeptidase
VTATRRGRLAARTAAAALAAVVVFGLVAALAAAAVVPVAAAAVAVTGQPGCRFGRLPPLACLMRRPPTRSVVYAADGSVLATLHGDEDRVVVPLAAIPTTVRAAVLAIEDARFYQHGALDPHGIARALLADVRTGGVVEGGSTIAQQYVKNVVTGDQVSLRRKLAEAMYAAQLERHMTKDQILAAYLNLVYFGDGVYGIATAAQHYFSEPPRRLSLAEAAALAGTIADPGRYRPTAGRAAVARRNQVLDRMAAVGFASPARAETGGLGRIDLALATAASANTWYAQLMARVGTPAAIRVARRMGITSPLRDYCSLVLGSEDVSPLELASAYGTLADGGVHCQPLAITRITDPSGRVLDAGRPSCRRVLPAGVAATATAVLRGVVAPGGTGFRAALGRPLAGKTGTTGDYRDAWFTGFTPQLVTSVWVGDAGRQVPMAGLFAGGPVYGGTFPALIFQRYMAAALAGQPVLDLPGPPGPPPAAGRAGWTRRR